MLRSRLLAIHPTDLWSEEQSRLTFVAFALGPGTHDRSAMAVFAVNPDDATLVAARVAEFGENGTVDAVHTLHPLDSPVGR